MVQTSLLMFYSYRQIYKIADLVGGILHLSKTIKFLDIMGFVFILYSSYYLIYCNKIMSARISHIREH